MRTPSLTALVVLSTLLVGGCVASTREDEINASAASEDALRSNTSYFRVLRRDVRRCAAPRCGGFVVQRVNDEKTSCVGGEQLDINACYVSDVDLRALDFTPREESDLRIAMENGLVVVQGTLTRVVTPRSGDNAIVALRAGAVWLGVTGSPPDGTFVSIARDPAPCMRAVCPAYVASTLSSSARTSLIDVVLDRTALRAEKHELAIAKETLEGSEKGKNSLLVVGTLAYECAERACPPSFVASEVYAPVIRREGKECFSWHTFDCNENQYCSYLPASICGAANAQGVCAYPTQMCTTIYRPVCGCDGKTYGNACQAASAGVSVAIEDACTDEQRVRPPTGDATSSAEADTN